jgi:hypothetical protein
MMPRLVKLSLLLCPILVGACATAHSGRVQTFPDKCPSGWQFLYTDHDLARGSDHTVAVCRAQSDSVARLPSP